MEYPKTKEALISRSKISKKHQPTRIHYHDAYELYYLANGNTTFFIEDKFYSVEKGDFVFVPSGLIHNTDNQNCLNTERVLFSFGEEFFEGNFQEIKKELMPLRLINIPEPHLPDIEQLIFQIEAEYNQNTKNRELLLNIYIWQLLIYLCRYHHEKKPLIKETEKVIYSVSKYIQSHYDQELTLKILSKTFSVSEGYLSRKFKAVTGLGISQYINFVRVRHSEDLLQKTNLSITEIALKCGYNDSSYFTAVFKKIKGITPAQHRKSCLSTKLKKSPNIYAARLATKTPPQDAAT